jgi:hypothetical protein
MSSNQTAGGFFAWLYVLYVLCWQELKIFNCNSAQKLHIISLETNWSFCAEAKLAFGYP